VLRNLGQKSAHGAAEFAKSPMNRGQNFFILFKMRNTGAQQTYGFFIDLLQLAIHVGYSPKLPEKLRIKLDAILAETAG